MGELPGHHHQDEAIIEVKSFCLFSNLVNRSLSTYDNYDYISVLAGNVSQSEIQIFCKRVLYLPKGLAAPMVIQIKGP
jgi:hypothetical protein